MNLRPSLLLLLLAAWTATGCVISRRGVNEPIDAALLNQFEPGKTTAKQVVGILGAPNEVVQLGYRTAYRYDRQMEKGADLFLVVVALRNSDTREDRVWLFFDEDETLTHMGSTFSAERTRYKLPWSKLH